MALPMAVSVLAASRTTPPSAHSILQSPTAISGSASTTRRPSKPRVRAISSSCVRAVSCSASLTRTTTCGAAASCLKHSVASAAISANGSRAIKLRRELAGDRGGELDGFGFEPRFDRAKPARQAVERVADLLERHGGAARGDRGAFLLGGGKAVAEALAFGLAELDGELGRRRSASRPRLAPAREVLVEQIFGLRRHVLSRPALRRATWTG